MMTDPEAKHTADFGVDPDDKLDETPFHMFRDDDELDLTPTEPSPYVTVRQTPDGPTVEMNVGQLIAYLRQFPPDLLVVASSDGEGNNFERVWEVTTGHFDGKTREFMDDEWQDETTGALTTNAVCIWPVG